MRRVFTLCVLGVLYGASLPGCVTVNVLHPDGTQIRARATGNATIVVRSNEVRAVAVDTAETYKAAGALIGTAAGVAAHAAITGQ